MKKFLSDILHFAFFVLIVSIARVLFNFDTALFCILTIILYDLNEIKKRLP